MRDEINSQLQNADKEDDATVPSASVLPALDLDADDHLPDLDGIDITEDQKRELLNVIWSIIRSFVHLGFDIGFVDPCGQIFGPFNAAAENGADAVKSSPSAQQEMPSTGTDKDHP